MTDLLTIARNLRRIRGAALVLCAICGGVLGFDIASGRWFWAAVQLLLVLVNVAIIAATTSSLRAWLHGPRYDGPVKQRVGQ